MNYHNFAQKTNFIGGSEKFDDMVFYMTSVNIPGITFNLPEVGGRYNTKAFLASDKITYNNLTFDVFVFIEYWLFLSHLFNFYLTLLLGELFLCEKFL